LYQITLIELIGSFYTYEKRIKDRFEDLDQVFQGKMRMNDQPTTSSSSKYFSRGHGGRGCRRGNHGRGRVISSSKSQILAP